MEAVDGKNEPVFSFSRLGIKSTKEPTTPDLKRHWLRHLATLLQDFDCEATRDPEPQHLEDGSINTSDMNLTQWQDWKRQQEYEQAVLYSLCSSSCSVFLISVLLQLLLACSVWGSVNLSAQFFYQF